MDDWIQISVALFLWRRDHLPSPVDFRCLTSSMDGTLAALQRLPKPLCKAHRSSKEMKVGRGSSEGRPEAPKKHQDVLQLVMNVVLKALAVSRLREEMETVLWYVWLIREILVLTLLFWVHKILHI